MLDRVQTLLSRCSTDKSCLPPTLLYNEGWMLRLVLSLFEELQIADHPLAMPGSCRWYSEALLPTPFLPRTRKDQFGESWTHADGVIGHFAIGSGAKGDLALLKDSTHFVVLEAQMFSSLSAGVSHARYYDQAARYVACIAETLQRANRHPSHMSPLGFYVLAPQTQVRKGIFATDMTKESIGNKVRLRATEYGDAKDEWLEQWFNPTLEQIVVDTLSWEEVIEAIRAKDSESGASLERFYKLCLRFNRNSSR